jgi:hypothetical protein
MKVAVPTFNTDGGMATKDFIGCGIAQLLRGS